MHEQPSRTVTRKFSIGELYSSVGGFAFCGGLGIIKLTKTPLIYSVSRFNLGGVELCLGEAKPTKAHMGTGLQQSHYKFIAFQQL